LPPSPRCYIHDIPIDENIMEELIRLGESWK
jgi:hypothetical protein